MDKDIEEARAWYENLRKELHPSNAAITEHGLEMIAGLLYVKKVGRWDDLMNDAELEAVVRTPSKMTDIAQLIKSWHVRTNEADMNETIPTDTDFFKSLYQLVAQIMKTLRVEMDKADVNNT